VWFSWLPRVSWHEKSHFFINAGALRKGMTFEQASARMRPFVMTVSADGEEVRFQPWPNARDACIAKLKGGRVRELILRHD
jgi:hypothetical protein